MRDATAAAAAVDNPGRTFHVLGQVGVVAVEIEVAADFTTPHLRGKGGQPYRVYRTAETGRLGERLAEAGLRASALLVATDFSGPNADEHIEWAARVVDAADDLGAAVVRIDPLARDKSLPAEQVRDGFIRGVRRLLEATAGGSVALGIENHGPHANDPAFLDEVLRAIPDPRLGLTLDTGNFYWFGHPLAEVYRIIERFAPRTKHTHVKNINYPPELAEQRRPVGQGYKEYCCPLDEGNIDLRRAVEILRRSGYTGALCVENEALFKYPAEERVEVLRRDVRAVTAAMQ